ncbi:MAG: aconitase family protein [Flavonifractor plautii]
MEFTGRGRELPVHGRPLCIANMAIEAGAKNGIFPVDDVTLRLREGPGRASLRRLYEADAGRRVRRRYTIIDLSALRPTVALPHLPDNTRTIGRGATDS